MAAPIITPIPTPPIRSDAPADFATKADAFAASLPQFVTEANTSAAFVDQRTIDADASAQAAAVSAGTASAKAGEASQSATAAQAYAANLESLDELWLGAATSDPATGKAGAPLVAGNAYVNSATGYLRAFNGSEWVQGVSAVSGVTSINGQTGPVDDVAMLSEAQTLTNKTYSGIYRDKTITNAAATGTVTLDLSQADVFSLTLSGATTLAISNAPALSGETFAIVVRVTQPATACALTWFSGITWLASGGTAPAAPAANKSVEYVLSTMDGTNWIGRKGAAN